MSILPRAIQSLGKNSSHRPLTTCGREIPREKLPTYFFGLLKFLTLPVRHVLIEQLADFVPCQ